MKIRKGFVSNSSSSSFIVLGKQDNQSHVKDAVLQVYEDCKDDIDYYLDPDSGETVVTIEGITIPEYAYQSYIEPYLEKLQSGYKMFMFEVGNELTADEQIDTILGVVNKELNLGLEWHSTGY